MTRLLLRAGFFCLAVVVLIRGAEHFQLVPMMGLGPDSPGRIILWKGKPMMSRSAHDIGQHVVIVEGDINECVRI